MKQSTITPRAGAIASVILTTGLLTAGSLVPVRAETRPQSRHQPAPLHLAQSSWQAVASTTGKYTVQMPGTPQQRTTTTTVGAKTLTWTINQSRNGSEAYAVAYTDLPLEVLELGREPVMEGMRNRLLASEFDWQVFLNQSHRISMGDIPGMEYLNLRQEKVSALRLFLVNRLLFAVFASANDLANASRFMDSFTVASIWQPFTSPQGRFSVRFPMAPLVTNETTQYKGKSLAWKKYAARNLYDKGDSYVVGYTDLAPGQRDAKARLDDATTAVLTSLGVPELSSKGRAISLNGIAGREFMGTASTGRSVMMRFYLVGNRLYGLFSHSQSLTNFSTFFNSFQVKEVAR